MNNENNNLNNENSNEVSVDNFFNPQEGESVNTIPLEQGINTPQINDVASDNLSSNTELNSQMPVMDTTTQTNDGIVNNDTMNGNIEMDNTGINNQQVVTPNSNEVNTNFNGSNDFSFSETDSNANNGVGELNGTDNNLSDLQKSINVEQPNMKNNISASTPGTETNIDMNGSNPVNATINVEQPSVNPEPMNNIGVQAQNTVPPQNITIVNKKSNKGLIIVLIIVMILAIVAAIGTYFLVIQKDSKTENDFDTNNNNNNVSKTDSNTTNTTNTSTGNDTIENDGLIYTKKSGYNYQIENGILYAYNDSSAFQFSALPVSYDMLIGQLGVLEETLTSQGYTFVNKKETIYSGKKVTSYEVLYDGKNVLYFMYPLYDEYSMVVIAYDKSNSIKYDLISEAIKLTSDVKKSDTATYAKSSDDVKFSDISGKLFE